MMRLARTTTFSAWKNEKGSCPDPKTEVDVFVSGRGRQRLH